MGLGRTCLKVDLILSSSVFFAAFSVVVQREGRGRGQGGGQGGGTVS